MRGSDERSGELFSYVDLEERVPAKHPLRLIRRIVNEVLVALDSEFTKMRRPRGLASEPAQYCPRQPKSIPSHEQQYCLWDRCAHQGRR
jgi:hypothetical protein